MGGGLMQLVAYGAQDVYLTGNPQITLFKVVYRRHTNFSSEVDEIPIETAKPGGRVSIQIQRSADLMTKTYHRTALQDLIATNGSFNGQVAWVRRLGHALIKSAEVQIGGSSIDKHYGVWLDIWFELTHTTSLERGYNELIGDVPELTTLANTIPANGRNVYTPFQFWFCRNYGLSLPLIALQYHDVRINIEYELMSNLVVHTNGSNGVAPLFNNYQFGSSGILIEYIYLDSEERRRFAQVGHEYLIEQLQYNEQNLVAATNQQFTLNFNHPCKELIWAHRCGAFNGQNGSSFLAYNNSDSNLDWQNALQAAAVNIATSMIQSTNSGLSGTVTTVTQPISDPVWSTSIGGSNFRFTLVNGNNSGAFTGNGGNIEFYVISNPLLIGNVNLASKLGTVSVDINEGTTNGTLGTFSVSVSGHSLSLDDLSIPIQKMTDNRTTAGKANDFFVVQLNNYGLRLDGKGNMLTTGRITLNGHDRFDDQTGAYFNYLEPNARHTRTPADGINVYSFGLHPEQHQPTGTCNMSRIDTARLIYKVADVLNGKRSASGVFDIYTGTVVYIFTQNYNILRMMAGMAGVAYSN